MVISGLGGPTFTPPTTGGAAAPDKAAGNAFTQALDSLQKSQSNVDDLAVKAATGDLTDVHDYTIAATQAGLQTDLTVAIRNKAVEAFTEVMRMPL